MSLVNNMTSHDNISFTSPESDFISSPLPNSLPNSTYDAHKYSSFDEPSMSISFSSPESDFTASRTSDGRTPEELARRFLAGGEETDGRERDLSFAAPESDFTGRAARLNADVPVLFEVRKLKATQGR